MAKPRIYVHRIAEWYPLYMDDANRALLASWANVVDDGNRTIPMMPDELVERLRDADGILSLNGFGAGEITAAVLERSPDVRVAAVGHWWHSIHNPAAAAWREAGVTVLDASEPCTDAVVEWVVASALMGVRRLPEFDRRLKAGESWAEPGRRRAKLFSECTVGLIGVGRIGRAVTPHFRLLGASVIAYDPFLSDADAAALGVRRVGLDELLRTADVVSLHMAVADATRGMLGAPEFALLREGAVFINSARSALYDTAALVDALRGGRFTAFIDVYDTEPLPLDDPLRALPNVFLTPHIAGDTEGMFRACGTNAIDTLAAWFAAHPV